MLADDITPQPPVGTARVGPLKAIPAILQQFGHDPAQVLAELNLELSLFEDSDNVIPFEIRGQLFGLCVARTGCKHFGLLIGQYGGLSSLGLIGYLAQQSPDVISALQVVTNYSHLHVQGASIFLELNQDTAFLGYGIYYPGGESRSQVEDGAIAIAYNILKKLCGPRWTPTSISLAHRKPDDVKPYQQFFKAPIQFNAEMSGVVFPGRWLHRTLPGADPELRGFLEKQVAKIEHQYASDFAAQVRHIIHFTLLSHRASSGEVARLLSMHPRSLHRGLKACDSSFMQLRDEVAYEMARQLLEDSSLDLSQIASTLGYADASSLNKAFRRWSGITPTIWRKKFVLQQ